MIQQQFTSNTSHFDDAFKFFIYLLRNGKVTADDKEMMRVWRTPEIKNIIYDVILTNAAVRIFEADNVIYMLPELDCELFSYDNEYIRKSMGLKNNTELYLAYFIILCLISLFYNTESGDSGRQYIQVNDLERFISTKTDEILNADMADINQKEQDTELKLFSVASHWEMLDPFNPDIKQMRRASKNRVSYILKVCRFFESEGHLQIKEGTMAVLEDSEVRFLPRLKHAIENEFFHSQRKDNILKMLKICLAQPSSII